MPNRKLMDVIRNKPLLIGFLDTTAYEAAKQMNLSSEQLTNQLWNNYHPQSIWMIFTGVGVSAAFLLFLYDRFILPTKKKI